MSSSGRVQVLVRTRKVPVGTTTLSTPIYTLSGVLVGSTTSRVVLYDTHLDESHKKAIRESRRLSCKLGLELEVVDASKAGPLGRLLSLVRRGASQRPAFLVAPQAEEDGMGPGLIPAK